MNRTYALRQGEYAEAPRVVSTTLRPVRPAVLIPEDDPGLAARFAESRSLAWGGHAGFALPFSRSEGLREPWRQLLDVLDPEQVYALGISSRPLVSPGVANVHAPHAEPPRSLSQRMQDGLDRLLYTAEEGPERVFTGASVLMHSVLDAVGENLKPPSSERFVVVPKVHRGYSSSPYLPVVARYGAVNDVSLEETGPHPAIRVRRRLLRLRRADRAPRRRGRALHARAGRGRDHPGQRLRGADHAADRRADPQHRRRHGLARRSTAGRLRGRPGAGPRHAPRRRAPPERRGRDGKPVREHAPPSTPPGSISPRASAPRWGRCSPVRRASSRRHKHIFGGALRQASIVAAGCVYALEHHAERLAEDHENARLLHEGLAEIPGLDLDGVPETNMVFFGTEGTGVPAEAFLARLRDHGVRVVTLGTKVRAVTHLDVSPKDVRTAVEAARASLAGERRP